MSLSAVMSTNQEDAFLRDIWYFAICSDELKSGQLLSVKLLGEPVLLGRLNNGVPFALRDICPHRGIPLSDGRLIDDEVECCYHGWRFDAEGTCTCIPSLTEDQNFELNRIKVPHYPTQEISGCIWIFMPSDFRTMEVKTIPPTVPDMFAKPAMREKLVFPCHIDHAVIGLMDPAHGPFVHQSWWWRSRKSIYKKSKEFGPADLGFAMLKHSPSSNSLAYKILGKDIQTEIIFRLPGIRIETIHVGSKLVVGLTTVTPIDRKTTQINHLVFWSMPYLSLLKPFLSPFLKRFLQQDRDIVEKQQRGLQYGPNLMLINDADVQAKWYFRLKKAYSEAIANKKPFVNPIELTTLNWRS